MAQTLPLTQVILTSGAISGAWYSPANGSNPGTLVNNLPITIPGGYGLVQINSVLLNCNSTYPGGNNCSVVLQTNDGTQLGGTGSLTANGDGSGSFNIDGGLRDTGIAWNINDGTQYPKANVASFNLYVTMTKDASAIIRPFTGGTSVQITAQYAPIPRRSNLLLG